jgi:DNA polymerase V
MSRRVVQTLEQLAPSVEVYSIDEAFLELSGFSEEAVPAMAAHIRRTVRQWTGIPVSVGIGPTKTLAKAANRIAKQNADAKGVWSLITPSSQHDALSQLPVCDVWGIGSQWSKLLEGQDIATALALSEQSDAWLKKQGLPQNLWARTQRTGSALVRQEGSPSHLHHRLAPVS